ncbi:MAG: amidophosphoribosyltransferase [Bacteroidota bacterium]|nr:amidophosphoribosyltransferase [Bacteroidota bacterium]
MSGFYGAISKEDTVKDVFYGTDYNSHLGTKRAGMVFYNPEDGFRRSIHSLENSYFRTKFEDDLDKFSGHQGIGIISDTDPQPIMFNSHLGRFAIATVCHMVNINELEQYFLKNKNHFTENFEGNVNPTEVVANLICEENDFVGGIENVYDKVKGSCSLIILTDDRIIAARDKLGRTPVHIGKKDNAYAVASETTCFPNTGYDGDYSLGPGEIVEITAEGYRTIRKKGEKMQICAFHWVYYGYPSSYYEGINVEECRYRCGAALARRDNVEADLVAGIPDSGVGHAIGYANERKVPYSRPYSKYTPTWPRSFMPQSQKMRDLVAKMKLIPVKSLIEGKRLILCDDSIVRGTQLKNLTMDLRKAGAREVHIRIACPPLAFPCNFLNFSQSRSTLELATRKAIKQLEGSEKHLTEYADPGSDKYRAMVNRIAKNMGMDSLLYQDLNDLVESIGLPKEKLCTHCWDGSSYY